MKKVLISTLAVFCLLLSFLDADTNKNDSYVGFRKYLQEKGYKISWDSYMLLASAEKDGKEIKVKLDKDKFVINGVLTDFSKPLSISRGSLRMSKADLDKFLNAKIEKNKMIKSSYDDYQTLLSFYDNNDMRVYAEGIALEGDMETAEDSNTSDMAESKSEHSETNNQESGVDESDLIKIDGKHIYTVRDGHLLIIDPKGKMKILHDMEFKDLMPTDLFLSDDKLVVIGSSNVMEEDKFEEGNKIISDYVFKTRTGIYVYDISSVDSAEPQLLKQYYVNGSINQARLIDDYIYIISNEYGFYMRPVYYDDFGAAETVKTEKPSSNEVTDLIPTEKVDINYCPGTIQSDLIYTIGIDLNDLSKDGIDVQAFADSAQVVYVSKNNMYTATEDYWSGFRGNKTNISKYSLNEGKVEFVASNEVDGYVHNQFSLGEYKGDLRVVTTYYSEVLGVDSNALYILDENLERKGLLAGLAKDERVYSVRMVDDIVYIVTFKETDPFFVIDASEPSDPKVLGYLKLPGFSDYMHPYDENTIIGIGNNTYQDKNGNVIVDGIKIALFDVSDFANPVLKDEVVKGSSGSYSDLSYDHKSFMLAKDKNILAFPASYSDDNYNYYEAASIFTIDADHIKFKGDIVHRGKRDAYIYDHESDGGSKIKRVFYIGDKLYTLSYDLLIESNISDLKTVDVLELK